MTDVRIFNRTAEDLTKSVGDKLAQLASEYFESNDNLASALLEKADLPGTGTLYVSPGYHGQLLSEIANSGDFTADHVDLCAAKLMLEAVHRIYDSCGLDGLELVRQNAEVNELYDRIEQLIPEENLSPRAVFAEQENLRGQVANERFKNTLRERRFLNASTEPEKRYIEQAARHYEKALELGSPDYLLPIRLGNSYKWLADLEGYDTEKGRQYAQKAIAIWSKELEEPTTKALCLAALLARERIKLVQAKLDEAK